jgi:hypothetical protein
MEDHTMATTPEVSTPGARLLVNLMSLLRQVSARIQLMSQHPRGDGVYRIMVRSTFPQIRASVPLASIPL